MKIQYTKSKWLKQSNLLGMWLGAAKLVAQHANIYIQFLILSFSGVSAYYVVSQWLLDKGTQLPFWVFALAVILVVLALMLFEWRLGLPSMFVAWNNQWWEHGNLLRREIKDMKEKLAEIDDIKKGIADIKESLGEKR